MFLKRGSFDTPTNHGPVVAMVTWFLTVTSVLWVFVRVGTKLAVSRKITIDDYLIFIALAFGICQCVAVSIQTYNGLGRHVDALSTLQKATFQKSGYTSDIFFVGNLCMAKLSIVLLLRTISPFTLHRRTALAIGIAIVSWAFTSEIVAVFQCSVPEPWRVIGNKCINQNTFWTYFGVLNIITDAALIFSPLLIFWKVQMDKKVKFSISCCFAARILVIASTVVQLVYIHRKPETADYTYSLWPVVLCNQVVQSVGIVTACVPYIKPFLESLESGMIRTDDLRRRGASDAYGYSCFSKSDRGRPTGPSDPSSSYKLSRLFPRAAGVNGSVSAVTKDMTLSAQNFATVSGGAQEPQIRYESDADSRESSDNVIKQMRTWEVKR